MVSTVLLLGLALTAAVTDWLWRKVYNWTTYPGILAGMVVSAFEPNGIGWEESLLGVVGCGLIMIFCFLCFNMGGGDVKLIVMLAAFLGWHEGVKCMLLTFVLGAAVGQMSLIWRFGALRLLARVGRQLWWLLAYRQWLPLTDEDRQVLQAKLDLAPAAVVAVFLIKFQVLDKYL